jgi:hypothetical protein
MTIEREIAQYICDYAITIWEDDGVIGDMQVLLDSIKQAPEEWEWVCEQGGISQKACDAILDGYVDEYDVSEIIINKLKAPLYR